MKATRLSAAIIAIVMSAFMVLANILLIVWTASELDFYLNRAWNYGPTTMLTIMIIVYSLWIFLEAAIIILAGTFCAKGNSRNNAIQLLILVGVSWFLRLVASFAFVGTDNFANFGIGIFAFVPYIAIITLCAIYIAMIGNYPEGMPRPKPAYQYQKPSTPQYCQVETPVQHSQPEVTPRTSHNEKIALLKTLKEDGTITEKEYKEKVLAILDSMQE